MNRDDAETISLRALGWLAGNEELLPVFMGASGASLQDLRERASDQLFLGSVLDFILMDDAWVIDCCDALGLPYPALAEARVALPGGTHINWT